jgi:hypothetical protein
MTVNRKNDRRQMLNFQCRQPNRTIAARTLNLALLLGHPIFRRREQNQLYATECFIALIICSTCFGQLYAHHQELETILVLLPHMVCSALVTDGRLLGAEQQAMRLG